MIPNVREIIVFSVLNSLSAILSMEDKELFDKLSQDPQFNKGYLEIISYLEGGVSEQDFSDLCNDLNIMYSDLGAIVDNIKDMFKSKLVKTAH